MKLFTAITTTVLNGKPIKGMLHVKYGCPYSANSLMAGFADLKGLSQAIAKYRAQRNPYRVKFQIVTFNKLAKHGIAMLTAPSTIATDFKGPVYRAEYKFIKG